ncbi:ABC transporter substrate-binding protein [Sinorhizobium meliloti]|uniref:ABC transporter substrate-binding protein n=1 Tax=Rhizobium meliloti TaxID=382 RepID=UPI0009B73E19|nr:ABC transporter substrate-binding protein [Sinorhizobium meliloti]
MRKVTGFMKAAVLGVALITTNTAKGEELVPVNIGYIPSLDHVAGAVAISEGTFEKYGIDAKLSPAFPSGVDMINAMQAGTVDIGPVGAPFFGAALNGIDIVAVQFTVGSATQLRADTAYGMIAREGSGIDAKDLSTLKGKKIATTIGSTNELYVARLLEANGLTPADVELVNTPPAEMSVALQTGGVDAIAIWEPFPTAARHAVKGSYEVSRGGGLVPNNSYTIVRGGFFREHPELVEAFIKARSEATQWARQHPDETFEIAQQWLPNLSPEVIKEALPNVTSIFDTRASACSLLAAEEHLEFVLSARKIQRPEGFDLFKVLDVRPSLKVMADMPELFSDQNQIPEVARLDVSDPAKFDRAAAKAACGG